MCVWYNEISLSTIVPVLAQAALWLRDLSGCPAHRQIQDNKYKEQIYAM